MSTVAERLSALLGLHGHSYRDARDVCGLDHTTILRVARGETENPATLVKITEGYGIPMSWLRGEPDVAMDFACAVMSRPMRERVLFVWEPRRRLGFALSFLFRYDPVRFTAQRLAELLGICDSKLKDAMDGEPVTMSHGMLERFCTETGLPARWFSSGMVGYEDEEQMLVGMAEWALTTLAEDLGLELDADEAHEVAVNLL